MPTLADIVIEYFRDSGYLEPQLIRDFFASFTEFNEEDMRSKLDGFFAEHVYHKLKNRDESAQLIWLNGYICGLARSALTQSGLST